MNDILIFLRGLDETQFNIVFCFFIFTFICFVVGIVRLLLDHKILKVSPSNNNGNVMCSNNINPATGLLMVGSIDTSGAPYGMRNTNPTTGLPMVGSIDTSGAPYGMHSPISRHNSF